MDIAGVTTKHYGSGSVADDVEEMRNQVLKVIETLVETVKKTPIKVNAPFVLSFFKLTHNFFFYLFYRREKSGRIFPPDWTSSSI